MSLKKKTISGLTWSGISQVGKQGIQFVITVILARLLMPKDFGLIGMATVITGFVGIFSDLGFSRALIYKQDINQDHLSSAFWINLFFGGLLTAILMIAAPLIAMFYKRPELTPIFACLSFNFVLSSLTIVQQTLITKRMDFKSLTIRDIVAVIISGIVGIILAWKGFGVWSLVIQTLVFTLANGILLWTLSSWRPSFIISKKAVKDLWEYSAHVTGFNIFVYFARNIDYLLIGRFLGPQALGLYTLAYKLMLLPLTNVTWVITKVMFPAFSQIKDELSRVRRVYLRMTKYISLVTFPLMCALFILAPEFILLLYGKKWQAVIPLVQIMCLCGLLQSVYSTTTSLLLSQGKSKLLFYLSIFNCILVTISVVVGLPWGIWGVACAYTIGQIGWTIYVQLLANRAISLDIRTFFLPLAKSMLIGLCVLAGIGILKIFIQISSLGLLVGSIAWGLAVYIGVIFLIDREEFNRALSKVLPSKG